MMRPRARSERTDVDWHDGLGTPPQEFDVAAELLRVQDIHDYIRSRGGAESARLTYEDLYAEALAHVDAAPGSNTVREVERRLALVGAQASSIARQTAGERAVVSLNCKDAPGVIASATVTLAVRGANIEGAVMSVIGGLSVMAFLVSGHAATDLASLEKHLARALRDFGVPQVSTAAVDPRAVEWPRPGSTYWHLTARSPGRDSLLREVCEVIAHSDRDGYPLVSVAAWLERDDDTASVVQVVDLNFAIESAHDRDPSRAARTIEAAIKERLPTAPLSIYEVRWPTRAHPSRNVVSDFADGYLLTVSGQARPGFLLGVVDGLHESGAEISGVSMAILENISVISVSLSTAGAGVALDATSVRAAVTQTLGLRPDDPALDVRVRALQNVETLGVDRPSHELSLDVREQPWVVAKLAQTLRDNGTNITWMASHVLKPLLDDRSLRCAVEMHLHVPQSREARLDEDLRSLAAQEGWVNVVLRTWTVSDNAQPTRLERQLTALTPEPLAKFDGFVAAEVYVISDDGRQSPSQVHTRPKSGAPCLVRVFLTTGQPEADRSERIFIPQGETIPEVAFSITVSAGDRRVDPPRGEVVVRGKHGGSLEFTTSVPDDDRPMTVHVRQRSRTVQILTLFPAAARP